MYLVLDCCCTDIYIIPQSIEKSILFEKFFVGTGYIAAAIIKFQIIQKRIVQFLKLWNNIVRVIRQWRSKQIMKRLPFSMICVLLCCSLAVGCGDSTALPEAVGTSNTEEQTQNMTLADTADPKEERLKPDLPEVDFNGYDFCVLHWDPVGIGWTSRAVVDIDAEAETGEAINDAVFRRNSVIEERYHVTVSMDLQNNAHVNLKKAVNAGDDVYSLVHLKVGDATGMVSNGYYYNIRSLPYMDLTKPWYDQNSIEALDYKGKLYMISTDITTEEKNATTALLFNKQIAQQFDLPDMYQMVLDGEWTFDAMQEVYRGITADIDGDGKMTLNDRWGFLGARDLAGCMYISGGGTYISRDDNGDLYDSFPSEYNITLVQKIQSIMCDTENFYNHHSGTQQAEATDDTGYCALFHDGKGLFYWARFDDVLVLRSMDADFGILPIPKYAESQESYLSLVSPYTSSLMSVPITISDPERTGILIEALAAESKYTLQPAYYEKALKGISLRDSESEEMLDIIFDNRVYDFGFIFDVGGWRTQLEQNVAISINKPVVSQYEKHKSRIDKALKKLVDKLEDLE